MRVKWQGMERESCWKHDEDDGEDGAYMHHRLATGLETGGTGDIKQRAHTRQG